MWRAFFNLGKTGAAGGGSCCTPPYQLRALGYNFVCFLAGVNFCVLSYFFAQPVRWVVVSTLFGAVIALL